MKMILGSVPLPKDIVYPIRISSSLLHVKALIINERREILLVQAPDYDLKVLSWQLPGGVTQSGESAAAATARIVLEDTNFSLKPDKLLAVGEIIVEETTTAFFLQKVSNSFCSQFRSPRGKVMQAIWVPQYEISDALVNNVIIDAATGICFRKAKAVGII